MNYEWHLKMSFHRRKLQITSWVLGTRIDFLISRLCLRHDILNLEDSKGSSWSGHLPNTMIYPNFDLKVVTKSRLLKMNDLKIPKISWYRHDIDESRWTRWGSLHHLRLRFFSVQFQTKENFSPDLFSSHVTNTGIHWRLVFLIVLNRVKNLQWM